jgi:hypothetical protein
MTLRFSIQRLIELLLQILQDFAYQFSNVLFSHTGVFTSGGWNISLGVIRLYGMSAVYTSSSCRTNQERLVPALLP